MGSLDQLKDNSLLGLPGVKPLRSPDCLRGRIPPLSPVAMTSNDSWRLPKEALRQYSLRLLPASTLNYVFLTQTKVPGHNKSVLGALKGREYILVTVS